MRIESILKLPTYTLLEIYNNYNEKSNKLLLFKYALSFVNKITNY